VLETKLGKTHIEGSLVFLHKNVLHKKEPVEKAAMQIQLSSNMSKQNSFTDRFQRLILHITYYKISVHIYYSQK